MQYFKITFYTLLVQALFVGLFGLAKWRKLAFPLRIIVVLKLASFLCDGLFDILRLIHVNPNYTSRLYAIIATILLAYFYFLVIKKRTLLIPIIFIGLVAIGLAVHSWLHIENESLFSLYISSHGAFILILGLIFYFVLLKEIPERSLSSLPLFWINTGLVVYYSGALLLFMTSAYIIEVLGDNFIIYWSFHNILGFISNALLFIGIWLGVKEGKMKQESI